MRIRDGSSDVCSSDLSFVVMMLAMFGHHLPWLSVEARTWIELVLTVPVVLWAGWPFLERCVPSIRNRSPNMWTLIGIGVTAAFGYRLVAPDGPGVFHHYFHDPVPDRRYYTAPEGTVSCPAIGWHV